MRKVSIGKYIIGEGEPCFIIAEAGSNHDGSLEQARKLIDIAADSGVDAVKFQTFKAEKIAAPTKAKIAKIDFGGAHSLFELYKKYEIPDDWHRDLAKYCSKKKLLFLSSPFDENSADLLGRLGIPAFKIASFELVHLPFLRYLARKNKPIILSTGMANIGEIEEALDVIYKENNHQVVLLHCAINYPANFKSINLKAMDTMKQVFQIPVGYSDHSPGLTVPICAAARGANIIEKHFTVDKTLPGPDHSFSLNPDELKTMVRCIREAEASLGSPIKQPAEDEMEHLKRGRRSLFARVPIASGTPLTEDMIAILRPGIGIKPKYLSLIIGRRVRKNIEAHEPITWEDI